MEQVALKPCTLLRHDTYRIEEVLGQGGFGITYLATDLSLDKRVAIKEFFPKQYCNREEATSRVRLGTQSNEEFVEKLKAKFLKEAKNIAKFDHPNIIKIHAAFEENGTAYYVMDFIEGESLSERVKREGALPLPQALKYVKTVGGALVYVHSFRMNHLDVKPANIMVRRADDCPILIDFGLSKQYDSAGNQTSTTPVGISHGFAPMEQYNDGGVSEFSPTTDEYSLAATLYYLLSAVTPPQSTRMIEEELSFPQSIPAYLIAPITKAMSSARKDRYPTVKAFIAALTPESVATPEDETVLANPQPKAETKPQPQPKPQPKSKFKWNVLAIVAALVAIVVIIVISSNRHSATLRKQAIEDSIRFADSIAAVEQAAAEAEAEVESYYEGKRRKLYNAISEFYNAGSYEEFLNQLQYEDKRRRAYEFARQVFNDVPDFETFSSDLGIEGNNSSTQSIQGVGMEWPKYDKRDSRRALYNALANEGYELPTYEEFYRDMNDAKKRKSLYDALSNAGYEMPTYDEFSDAMMETQGLAK